MKLFTILFVIVISSFAVADNTNNLEKMLKDAHPAEGCLPRRNPTTGNIDGYDCSQQTKNKDLKFEKGPKLKKVTLQKTDAEQVEMPNTSGAANEAMIKTCLASVYVLQKDYHNNRGVYADNLQQLAWGNNDCLNNFEGSINQASKSQFEVVMTSKVSTWSINQDKKMVKIK